MAKQAQSLIDRLDQRVFDAIYSRSLVYNSCWEDPAVDRLALALRPQDRMLAIASAGCNVLDYALVAPACIHAVDANPRQTALLQLKLAGIRHLDFEDFFALFGEGRHPGFDFVYRSALREHLPQFARDYWDRHGHWFCEADPGGSFYYHGLSGMVARGFRTYLRWRPGLRAWIEMLLEARSLDLQRRIYERQVRPQYWPAPHNTFVQKMLKRARHEVKVMLVPGNHDEAMREYVGSDFGDIRVVREAIHTTADGRRYLLIHGDEFDQITRYHRWVALLGDFAYDRLLRLNGSLSWARRRLRLRGYWSLAGYAKRKVKGALEFVYGFEESVAHHVRQMGLDGVVCGHIHSAAIKNIGGIRYINCGDWVDSCTAVVEHDDGRMELVRWQESELLGGDLWQETAPVESAVLARVVPLRQR